MSDPENKSQAEAAAAAEASTAGHTGEEIVVEASSRDEASSDGPEVPTDGETAAQGENLAVELETALQEMEKFRDAALRAEAEMENVRRRAARDVENAHKFGLEKFLSSLLPVVDSLEKAIEAADQAAQEGANKAIADGVSLCLKMMLDELGKQGVEVLDPVGEPFDPNLHQAMSMVENPDAEPNSVVAVIQKGYTLNARLVRPAMVMVAKAPSAGIDEKA